MDENQSTANDLLPMTAEEFGAIRVGNGVRVITPRGDLFEGLATKVFTYGARSTGAVAGAIVVCGRAFRERVHEFYSIPAHLVSERTAPKIDPSAGEVVNAVAALGGRQLISSDERPQARPMSQIVVQLLGFEASGYPLTGADFGGKSDDGWRSEHVALSRLRATMKSLVDNGELVKVVSGTRFQPSADDRVAYFQNGTKTGWVLRSEYDASVARRETKVTEAEMNKLRAVAGEIVLTRYGDEVEVELARLIAGAGL